MSRVSVFLWWRMNNNSSRQKLHDAEDVVHNTLCLSTVCVTCTVPCWQYGASLNCKRNQVASYINRLAGFPAYSLHSNNDQQHSGGLTNTSSLQHSTRLYQKIPKKQSRLSNKNSLHIHLAFNIAPVYNKNHLKNKVGYPIETAYNIAPVYNKSHLKSKWAIQ